MNPDHQRRRLPVALPCMDLPLYVVNSSLEGSLSVFSAALWARCVFLCPEHFSSGGNQDGRVERPSTQPLLKSFKVPHLLTLKLCPRDKSRHFNLFRSGPNECFKEVM